MHIEKSTTSIKTDCPFCNAKNTQVSSKLVPQAVDYPYQGKPRDAAFELPMTCGSCESWIIVYFTELRGFERTANGDPTKIIKIKENSYKLSATQPIQQTPYCPSDTPKNVERAFVEAESARLACLFSAAASHYRKTVDRAITPLLPKMNPKDMLGKKLGALEKGEILPDVMLEWIRIVKDDGDYAMHDDDRDFETAEEIEPARQFTKTLLHYLFTMPKDVERARATIEARDKGEAK